MGSAKKNPRMFRNKIMAHNFREAEEEGESRMKIENFGCFND